MTAKRKTSKDYKEEMQDLLNKTEKLQMIIITRLYTLCASHPDVIVENLNGVNIKAKSLIPINGSKDYIKSLPVNVQIYYIGVIEQYLESLHPHKQTAITF